MDKKDVSKAVSSASLERDPLFEAAARYFVEEGHSTIAMFMFDNGIGYNRACRIVEQLEAAGIVGPNRGRKPREVLVDLPTLEAMLKKELIWQKKRKLTKRPKITGATRMTFP